MTLRPLGFRRLVLGLQPGAPASSTELAVELASLFDLELIGLFIDDVALGHRAAMPAARAISALGAACRKEVRDKLSRHSPDAASDDSQDGRYWRFSQASLTASA